MTTGSSAGRYRLEWSGAVLHLAARRVGLRTEITLYRDGEAVAEGTGIGRVMLPLPTASATTSTDNPAAPEVTASAADVPEAAAPETGVPEMAAPGAAASAADVPEGDVPEVGEGAAKPPMVLAVAVVPGTIVRAFLMVPRPAVAEGQEAEAGEAPQDGEREMAGVEDAVGADGGGAAEKSGEAKKGSAGAGRPDEGLDEAVAELPEGLAKLVGFARAERYPFEPPPGTFAARLLAFQREHPKLYASRHVVLATGKVVLGLLGVAVFFQLILSRVIQWIIERLPNMDLPGLPLPDLDLPSIPWPHIPLPDLPDLPDVTLPGWLKAVLATAKYWIPILIAIGAAVQEVRKRKRRSAAAQSAAEPDGPPADRADATEPEPAGRATRPTGAAVRQGGEPAWRDGEPAQRAGEAVRRDGEVTRRAGETASARARPGTGEDGADTRRTGGDRQPDAHR